jgi:tripartite-type tricarboxylate transporter receptor subunit TctC
MLPSFLPATRRALLLTAAALFASGPQLAGASTDYPKRPIRLVIPFAPGGGTDIIGRVIAEKLSTNLGQPIVVINTPGAGGTIGGNNVAKAEPDGYTLLLWHVGIISSAHTNKPLPYDPLKDFTPIGQVATAANLIAVNPQVPARTLKELVALGKSKPDTLHYGSSGIGGADHLAGELFSQVAGIKTVHVPYKGGGLATIAAVSGEVQFVAGSASQVMTMVKAGKLRPLAVMQKQRIASLPDVPGAPEAELPELDYQTWFALWGPARMPTDVVAKLSAALKAVLNRDDVRAQLEKGGVEPAFSTPQQFDAMVRAEHTRWNRLLADLIK